VSVLAVVAAAGASRRMGRAKALVPFGDGGPPLVVHVVRALVDAGVARVVVTVPDDPADAVAIHDAVVAALPPVDVRRLSFARNAAPALGLSGSVRAALAVVDDDTSHLIVTPVDAPFFDGALVRALLDRANDGANECAVDVVVPVDDDGARGHPVVFARACFPALFRSGERGGPVVVVDDAEVRGRLAKVSSTDARVSNDVDTPDDWERAFGARWPRATNA
jgi:molybdenum cofactor cytidylyltransferase